MRLNNKSGSILIITLAFVLIFILLGVASIYYAGAQNEFTSKQNRSNQAFWFADAGIEVAKTRTKGVLQALQAATPPPLPNEKLLEFEDEFGAPCADGIVCTKYLTTLTTLENPATPGVVYKRRLKATSVGTVKNDFTNPQNIKIRTIEAVIAESPVINAITANGTINTDQNKPHPCAPDGSAQVEGTCEHLAGVTLFNFFGMVYNYNTITQIATLTDSKTGNLYTILNQYDDSDYDSNDEYTKLTVIVNSGSHTIDANKINTGHPPTNTPANPGFLIIDCENSTADPCLKSTGSVNFNGIIWVLGGDVAMTGTPGINGSLFVENGNLDANFSGDNSVIFDEEIINEVLEDLGGNLLKEPTFASWKEI